MQVVEETCCSGSIISSLLASRNGLRGRAQMQAGRRLALLMLGLDNAGKTVTSRCLVGSWDPLQPTAPTVGFNRLSTRYNKIASLLDGPALTPGLNNAGSY